MLIGLKQLHDKSIIHRDIKTANYFVSQDGSVKLGDFNVSKLVQTKNSLAELAGTPNFAAPELWLEKAYNEKSDIWSVGCCVY